MDENIKRAAKDIIEAGEKKVVALTGAGMSVESGIPPFRGKGGLWEKFDPEEYAHIATFKRDPARSWNMLKDLLEIITRSEPNPGHLGLAELEKMGYLSCIITQNVDGLHQRAGNQEVVEFHGNNRWLVCLDCGKRYEISAIFPLKEIPPKCAECGGNKLKPDAVFFGEMIPPKALFRSEKEASSCKVMLAIGTSAVVYPAASMPEIAKQYGAKIIEINPERTPLTSRVSNYIIEGAAAKVMPQIVEEVRRLS
jgi:NAD-dependent deacetylase